MNEYDPPRTAVAEAWAAPARLPLYARPGRARPDLRVRSRGRALGRGAVPLQHRERARAGPRGAAPRRPGCSRTTTSSGTRRGSACRPAPTCPAWLMTHGTDPVEDRAAGLARARAGTLLLLALPGSAYLYQGEELGLPEVADIPFDALEDPIWERHAPHREGPRRRARPAARGPRRGRRSGSAPVDRTCRSPPGSPTSRCRCRTPTPHRRCSLYRPALATRAELLVGGGRALRRRPRRRHRGAARGRLARRSPPSACRPRCPRARSCSRARRSATTACCRRTRPPGSATPRDRPGSAGAGEALAGGNSNAPVRFGDRVHRTAGPWSPTIHAYLRHLRAHGVDLVPEPFGFDERGPGGARVPARGSCRRTRCPRSVWTDAFLRQAARVLRRLHDASIGFDPAGAVWQQPAREPAQVVSVNDFAPYNLVLDGDRISGVIDLDQASPGPRVRDLAHLAYRLVPLTAPENGTAARRPSASAAGASGCSPTRTETVGAGCGPRRGRPAAGRHRAHADDAGRPDHGDLYRADAARLGQDRGSAAARRRLTHARSGIRLGALSSRCAGCRPCRRCWPLRCRRTTGTPGSPRPARRSSGRRCRPCRPSPRPARR